MTIQMDVPVITYGAIRGERTPGKQRNPSARHQALLELMKMFPATLLRLVEPDLQIGYPIQGPLTARVSDCDAYGLWIDARLDFFQAGDDDPILAIVVEVQLEKENDLRWRLCPYVGFTSHDARCATDIVVLCGNRRLAKKLARPMLMGARGSNITPLPIGPDQVPVIDNLEDAMADPGMLMLSGWHHAEDSDEMRELLVGLVVQVLRWLEPVDKEKAQQCHRLAMAILPTTSMRRFKEMTATALQEFLANEAYPEWTCEGRAQDILDILETREIVVPDDIRAEFLGCQDPKRLTTWLKRAVTAATARDVIVG
jgi:hypothetical protein